MKTISVNCPCGASFEREVKRGRPAVWCPACREIPFEQRTARTANEVVAAVTETVSRFGEHDVLNADARETVEANIAQVRENYNARVESLRAEIGEHTWLNEDPRWVELGDWYAQALRDAYDSVR